MTITKGREADSVEAIVTGHWPMLDVRKGWDVARLCDDVGELSELGVDRVVAIICGDDPGAAEDTVRRLAEDVIA